MINNNNNDKLKIWDLVPDEKILLPKEIYLSIGLKIK